MRESDFDSRSLVFSVTNISRTTTELLNSYSHPFCLTLKILIELHYRFNTLAEDIKVEILIW